jgi:hypothetical protein
MKKVRQTAMNNMVTTAVSQTRREMLLSSDQKVLGDAGEHYTLSMLSFAGKCAAKMPDNWKGYDLAVEDDGGLVRVSVKTRSQTERWTPLSHYRFDMNDEVEWFVFILKQKVGAVRAWVVPRNVAIANAKPTKEEAKAPSLRRIPFKQLTELPLSEFEDNWTLDRSPHRRSRSTI